MGSVDILAVAILTEEKPAHGYEPPFGNNNYMLMGLYATSGTAQGMMGRQRERAVGEVIERRFVPKRKAVDKIAMELAEAYGGIFRGAVDGSVGYVAFKDKSEALRVFNSLGNGR